MMSFLWCLALPLFFCCWEAGAARSSAGPSGSGHTELPAVTSEVWTSSEEVFQATDFTEPSVPNHVSWETQTLSTQTSDKTFIRGGTVSEAETREDKIMTLMTRKPSKFTAVITTPMATSSKSGSHMERVRTTVDTVTGSELWKVVFENLCTFDSSEEAKRILKFTHISAEAEVLSSESSASSDSSVPAVTTSRALSADITALTEALVTYITSINTINCRVMETEPTAAIPETSHIDHSSAGGQALSTHERSALPDSTEAKSHLTRNTISVETWATAHATESVTPAVTVILRKGYDTSEKETTAAKATTPSGTLVTVSKNLLEESSALSVETTSDTSISEIITVFTEDATAVSKVTPPAGLSAMVYSFSEETSTTGSTSSEASTTHSTFSGPLPTISRSSRPSFHLPMVDSIPETSVTSAKTTASANSSPTASADSTPETNVSSTEITASTNSSSETSVPSAKTTDSVKTLKTASAGGGKASTTSATTARTRWTDITPGADGGFLLLRLSVSSPEDLTDPKVAERLMHQLSHKLDMPTFPVQVSLLHVRSG